MTGKVIIVTGASSGLGFEISKYLAEGGNDVVLACRDKEKAEDAVTKIKTQYPSALVQSMELDLCSSSSIRNFSKEFMRSKRKLNVLINNAGAFVKGKNHSPELTSEGLECNMSSNYFGHFLLTHLLLDYLSQTATIDEESRIINITCRSHNKIGRWYQKDLESLDPNNMQLLKMDTYTDKQAYKNSKLCSVLFTYKLADEVKAENVTPGKYYKNGRPSRSSLESYDLELQRSLWKNSCKVTGIRGSMAAGAAFDNLSLKD
ncbi:hypothetical protein HELRODRAFT_172419 [Helobdella robusta]|uniref:Uncharacterized protein n=1 Tax=Helobdella robusta TaxID=6412 RepID=T1F5A9_HELRO|nr:hypothetical protein HELRODRAFT_172419 [Helobdella robusta]ESO04743.1 hypothetical protein HELRODRAFT_172419 [Helobdella robusta]